MKRQQPITCPICRGKGNLGYIKRDPIICDACGGTGIIKPRYWRKMLAAQAAVRSAYRAVAQP